MTFRCAARETTEGDLEKLTQPAIAGIFGLNSRESNRKQNGIVGGQIWDACRAMTIFRGPLRRILDAPCSLNKRIMARIQCSCSRHPRLAEVLLWGLARRQEIARGSRNRCSALRIGGNCQLAGSRTTPNRPNRHHTGRKNWSSRVGGARPAQPSFSRPSAFWPAWVARFPL